MPYGREDEGDEGFSKDDSDCDKMKRWMTGCYLIWAAFDEGLFEGDSDRDRMKRWRRDVISYTVFARKWKYVLIAREWKDEWQDVILFSYTLCITQCLRRNEKVNDKMSSHTQYLRGNEKMYWLLGNEKMNDRMLFHTRGCFSGWKGGEI